MNMNKLITFAAVAASAAIPMAANAAFSEQDYSVTTNGITWYFKIDQDKTIASVGTNLTAYGYSSDELSMATDPRKLDLTGSLTIPESFSVDGTEYKVAYIGNRAFLSSGISHIVYPSGAYYMYHCSLYDCDNLTSVWFKGPATVSSGTQNYNTLRCHNNTAAGNWANQSTAIKYVLVGPNLKVVNSDNRPQFKATTGCTFFLPDRPENDTWRTTWDQGDDTINGKKPVMVYYGPTNAWDLVIDDSAMTATFMPTSGAALANAMSYASVFKEQFGLDSVIAITNRLEISEDISITETMLQNVTLTAPAWYLTFKVTSQAQLDNVLAAVSADIPIIIDIDGIGRNQIAVPDGRRVAILAKSGWTFGRRSSGLTIIVE